MRNQGGILEGGAKRLGALLLKVGAVPMIPVGLGLMLWGLFHKLENNSWRGEDPLSAGVSLVVMGAILWFLSRRLDSAASLVRQRRLENRIQRLAAQRDGRLTVTDAAMETGFTVVESEAVLKSLAEGGYVEIEVTESGLIVYRFPEILFGSEKSGFPWTNRAETI